MESNWVYLLIIWILTSSCYFRVKWVRLKLRGTKMIVFWCWSWRVGQTSHLNNWRCYVYWICEMVNAVELLSKYSDYFFSYMALIMQTNSLFVYVSMLIRSIKGAFFNLYSTNSYHDTILCFRSDMDSTWGETIWNTSCWRSPKS